MILSEIMRLMFVRKLTLKLVTCDGPVVIAIIKASRCAWTRLTVEIVTRAAVRWPLTFVPTVALCVQSSSFRQLVAALRTIFRRRFLFSVDFIARFVSFLNYSETRMWANAQRDGCPAEYRWRPLFNAAVLWGHVEEILLLNTFFSDCRYMP